MCKTHQVRSTFGSWDVETVHAVVARSTFPSQNAQNASCLETLLEVEMSKKCSPLRREAHFQVRMCKTPHVRKRFWKWRCRKKCTPSRREAHVEVKSAKKLTGTELLDVRISFRAAGARDCAPCQKWTKREGFVAVSTTTTTTLHSTALQLQLKLQLQLHYTTLHSTPRTTATTKTATTTTLQ